MGKKRKPKTPTNELVCHCALAFLVVSEETARKWNLCLSGNTGGPHSLHPQCWFAAALLRWQFANAKKLRSVDCMTNANVTSRRCVSRAREIFASRPERAMRRSPGAANLARLVLLKIERRGGLVFIWLNSYEGGDECRAVMRKLRCDALKAYRARTRAAFEAVAPGCAPLPPELCATVREFLGHSKNLELYVLALMHVAEVVGCDAQEIMSGTCTVPTALAIRAQQSPSIQHCRLEITPSPSLISEFLP